MLLEDASSGGILGTFDWYVQYVWDEVEGVNCSSSGGIVAIFLSTEPPEPLLTL